MVRCCCDWIGLYFNAVKVHLGNVYGGIFMEHCGWTRDSPEGAIDSSEYMSEASNLNICVKVLYLFN